MSEAVCGCSVECVNTGVLLPWHDGGVPRLADHAERRAALADAVFAVVAREGLRGASVRTIAAEVGWSPGAVRHYFSAQHDLLAFAMEEMDHRIAARVMDVITWDGPGEECALELLEQLLPLDDLRRQEVAVYVEFVVAGRTDERLRPVATRAWQGERWLVRAALAQALGLDSPQEAQTTLPAAAEGAVPGLHAVVDGLTLSGVGVPQEMDAAALRAVLREALAAAVARAAG